MNSQHTRLQSDNIIYLDGLKTKFSEKKKTQYKLITMGADASSFKRLHIFLTQLKWFPH